MRAVFEIGREPERDDGLRQVPDNDDTQPTLQTIAYVRRSLDAHRERLNALDARRSLQQRVRDHVRDAASPYREAEPA